MNQERQDPAPLPEAYESWTAKEKQDYLWDQRIVPTQYAVLPDLTPIDVLGLFLTPLRTKMDRHADQVVRGWKKAIHAHGAVAKVRYESLPGHPYTGMFRGADHGLLRLSLTGDPRRRGFAPGLALKLLRDGAASANLSALVSLTGQGNDYNFFANELSNIVPVVREFGPKFINLIFRRVTHYPTKLYLADFGERDQHGQQEASSIYPLQIFFVPHQALGFASSSEHDFRNDLATLEPDVVIYDVLGSPAASNEAKSDDLRPKALPIARLRITSHFLASAYGDDSLFFRHQRFLNK